MTADEPGSGPDEVIVEHQASGVALVRTDDFATWDEPVRWWPRFADGVLAPLRRGEPGGYRRTEWTEGRPHPGSWVSVPVPDVLIFEGVSAARRAVSGCASLSVWVELVSESERLARAVARDGECVRDELARWQRFEADWFARDDTRARAEVRLLT